MRYHSLYTIGLFLVCLAFSCGADSLDKDQALREIAGERLERMRRNITRDCREEVLAAANQRADSLLLDRAKRLKRLADRPPKPVRPGEPPERALSTDLPLRPLFPFEIRFDSLLRKRLTRDSLMRDTLLAIDTIICADCEEMIYNQLSTDTDTASWSQLGILDIYCLLESLESQCATDQSFQSAYSRQFYSILFHRPRAVELSLEALDRHPDSLDIYYPEWPASDSLPLVDSLRMLIQQEKFSPLTEKYLGERF